MTCFRKFRDSAIRTEFNQMSVRNQDVLDEDLSPLSGAKPTVASGNESGRGFDNEEEAEGHVTMYVIQYS